ncbi:CycB3 [Drosophila busckii]|uniref:CycB3 n=1 Tax=Drosophila busckii TaxID=30019 RepID=A0A0M3QYL5_DROBS|nr:G2/mitotic-specific cyclin-B3 [Drosophila busckii]ALC47829.1 CycB3 [Drosophila busckii]
MAPTKGTTRTAAASQVTMNAILPMAAVKGKGLTRRVNNGILDSNVENMQTRAKRKADNSPIKNDKIKRSALGNLTNNVKIMTLHASDEDAKPLTKKPTAQQLQVLLDAQKVDHVTVPLAVVPNKIMTRASTKSEDAVENCHKVLDKFEEALARQKTRRPAAVPKKPAKSAASMAMPAPVQKLLAPLPPPAQAASTAIKPARRISNDFNKTEDSLYMSALEDVSSCDSMRLSGNFEAARRRSAKLQTKTEQAELPATIIEENVLKPPVAVVPAVPPAPPVPEDVEDFDRKNWDDPFQVSHYAMDIFNYLKMRESEFIIPDYMPKQINLTPWMRTLLVDWMVEVQETFELNHETLYLAVKIVDLYLSREVINKEKLQLLGAAAFFIACKYDERQPPLISDFLYICDGAYTHDELVKMEMETLRTIKYDLGIPLSYRFLRRYARCAKVQMNTLTLARYILEYSLMDYDTIGSSDSQLASAALFMALRMNGGLANLQKQAWTSTLIYYTGYELTDFADKILLLNAGLHRKPRSTIKTIRNKYTHKIFHEVATVPLLSNEQLFMSNLDLNDSSMST